MLNALNGQDQVSIDLVNCRRELLWWEGCDEAL